MPPLPGPLHRVRTALAEREVVLGAAALVAVAFDRHDAEIARVELVGVLPQPSARIFADLRAVVVEVHGLEAGQLARPLHARPLGRRRLAELATRISALALVLRGRAASHPGACRYRERQHADET